MSAPGHLHVAIAVQGRFHAFDLARALALLPGVQVTLLTNYTRRECARFGIHGATIITWPAHRWLVRIGTRLWPRPMPARLEAWIHESFGRWACQQLERLAPRPDVIRIFSGVAEETLRSTVLGECVRLVVRGSAHIRAQRRILDEEERRVGVALDKPSDYMIAREEREYRLADKVVILSSFSRSTFVESGFSLDRLWLLPNSVDAGAFGVTRAVAAARRVRIVSSGRLRVLTVGSFSFRKGIADIAQVVSRLSERFAFRFVGDVPPEGRSASDALSGAMEFVRRVPPHRLAAEYAWGDIFYFPTIEDGFPAVLTQALAAGLPVLTTPNGSGPDLVVEGKNGWCIPIRASDQACERLLWLDANRDALARAAEAAATIINDRSWAVVASEFAAGARDLVARRRSHGAGVS